MSQHSASPHNSNDNAPDGGILERIVKISAYVACIGFSVLLAWPLILNFFK